MLKRAVVALVGALLVVGVSTGNARASVLFESNIAGKRLENQEIAGISPDAAAPWVVAGGEVEIGENGKLELNLGGLLLLEGTIGPVLTVFASLVCQQPVLTGAPTNEVVASTLDVPLSAAGDAEINEAITLPSSCVAPIVLVRIRLVDVGFGPVDIEDLGLPPPWIAASGF